MQSMALGVSWREGMRAWVIQFCEQLMLYVTTGKLTLKLHLGSKKENDKFVRSRVRAPKEAYTEDELLNIDW